MKKLLFSVKMFAVIGTLFIFACKKEQTMATDNTIATTDAAYEVKNGTLHFKDADAFIKTLEEVRPLDMEKRSHFGEQFGFKSLLKCYVTVLEKTATTDENDQTAYFQVLRDNADIITFQDNGIYDLKVDNKLVSAFLNREGIVFVGKHVYKFTDFGQITVLTGDVNQFIGVTAHTKSTKDVLVYNNSKKLLAKCGLGRRAITELSDRKGILEARLICTQIVTGIDFATSLPIKTLINSAHVQGTPYKKNIWGNFVNYRTLNGLDVNHRQQAYAGHCSIVDRFAYSNDYYGIDFNGASCTITNVLHPYVSLNEPLYDFINTTYKMPRTHVMVNITCN